MAEYVSAIAAVPTIAKFLGIGDDSFKDCPACHHKSMKDCGTVFRRFHKCYCGEAKWKAEERNEKVANLCPCHWRDD